MTPTCPPHYTCTFSPKNPPHYWAHWYDGGWGIIVAILALIALVTICCACAYWWSEARRRKLEYAQRERDRQQSLALEEQWTMQIDAAKGNPEMLKMVREMQQRARY